MRTSATLQAVRKKSEELCEPLAVEDYIIQTCPDVSPAKWHLAHTSWFFETFLLQPFLPGYKTPQKLFAELFNSYYNAIGPQFARAKRGTLSRPTVQEVMSYRVHVTHAMQELLDKAPSELAAEVERRTVLGIHHEQQHQELMLTDLKHCFGHNPILPAYLAEFPRHRGSIVPRGWSHFDAGLVEIGNASQGFHFDNETPRHRVFLEPFAIRNGLVTQAEYLSFVQDGGYSRPDLWLSDGWDWIRAHNIQTPLYWHHTDGVWQVMTLYGLQRFVPNQPVCHVSFFEADAFARWAGARLPTEHEWEHAASRCLETQASLGTLLEDEIFHPIGKSVASLEQAAHFFGEVWEWTSSPYTPYPNYQTAAGALGEYNGKFMNGQRVLRGGSCVTSQRHMRTSYRNFFPPEKQWQFSGIRLAKGSET